MGGDLVHATSLRTSPPRAPMISAPRVPRAAKAMVMIAPSSTIRKNEASSAGERAVASRSSSSRTPFQLTSPVPVDTAR